MPDISVNNKDWSVVAAVRDALAAAKVNGEAVFRSVLVTTADAQAARGMLQTAPAAVVRYLGTSEQDSPEDARFCLVSLELVLAAQIDGPQFDESSRLEEALRLRNAAINAVEADPPEEASAWGDGQRGSRAIQWGQARVDAGAHRPWAVCLLPVEIGLVLSGPTAH